MIRSVLGQSVPSYLVACYANCHWGKAVAVTLLAPGRRWSLTYGSASPFESMAFSPCGHREDTHILHTKGHVQPHLQFSVKGDVMLPSNVSRNDRVRKRQGIWGPNCGYISATGSFFPIPQFWMVLKVTVQKNYIINIMCSPQSIVKGLCPTVITLQELNHLAVTETDTQLHSCGEWK